jgi:hypothetical protein
MEAVVSYDICSPRKGVERMTGGILTVREIWGDIRSVAGGIMSGAMSPQISIDRNAVSAFCRRHHIARLALFGSVLRDDFGPESDIDVLVEFQPGHVPGLKFVSIERELSVLLHGRRVDMVTSKFLNARIRAQVLGSAEPLYVAA